MRRDFHAAYLTDPRAMDAARDRAVRHGEDGWAAAYTVALTLPAGPGAHAATGARDVLVPQTLPDADELARLEYATSGDDECGGYYDEPGIAYDNPDMAPSMTRRPRDGELIRPDLRCPKCCEVAGESEELGVPYQTYRCTGCRELWNYVPPTDDDEHARGECYGCVLHSIAGHSGMRWFVDEVYELMNPARDVASEAARAANARTIADAFGLPEHVVRGETGTERRARLDTQNDELLALLHMVSRGLVIADQVGSYPGVGEARRRRLLIEGRRQPGQGRRSVRRVDLSALGRIVYLSLYARQG